MAKKNDNFRKKVFEHDGYKIDATKGFLRFNILDDDDKIVGSVRINKSAYDTHNTAMLIIHDSDHKPKFSAEQNRAIVELFAKYTASHGLEPTSIIHDKSNNGIWDGKRSKYINRNNGVPKNIEGEFMLVSTSPDSIPCIVNKTQRDELARQNITIYGNPVSFLPYSTNHSIKDNIISDSVEVLSFQGGSGSFLIINDKDDLKNSTFVQTKHYDVIDNRARTMKICFDNRSEEAVEVHGIDKLQSHQLCLTYKDSSDNRWIDLSHVRNLNFRNIDTHQTHNLWLKGCEYKRSINEELNKSDLGLKITFGLRSVGQWAELDPDNIAEGKFIDEEEKRKKDAEEKQKKEYALWKITNRKSDEYRKNVQDIELELYKTLKSINENIGDNLKIEYDKYPLLKEGNSSRPVENKVISFIKDYEKDHENELNNGSNIKLEM